MTRKPGADGRARSLGEAIRAEIERLRRQGRELAPLLAALYVPATAILLAGLAYCEMKGRNLGYLTREPAAILGGHALTGALSQLGGLVWSAAAAVCFLTWLVKRGRPASGRVPPVFFLASGLFMAAMMVDDVYQFHEELAPIFLHVPDEAVVLFYVLVAVVWLVLFWRTILETDYVLLVIAAVCSAISVLVDALSDTPTNSRYLLEDGFKLLGIVGWLGYLGRVCYRALTDR
jgi:hypothetical protein